MRSDSLKKSLNGEVEELLQHDILITLILTNNVLILVQYRTIQYSTVQYNSPTKN